MGTVNVDITDPSPASMPICDVDLAVFVPALGVDAAFLHLRHRHAQVDGGGFV